METFEHHIRSQEQAEADRYTDAVLDALKELIGTGHNTGCWPVPLGEKDADLANDGCAGVQSVRMYVIGTTDILEATVGCHVSADNIEDTLDDQTVVQIEDPSDAETAAEQLIPGIMAAWASLGQGLRDRWAELGLDDDDTEERTNP